VFDLRSAAAKEPWILIGWQDPGARLAGRLRERHCALCTDRLEPNGYDGSMPKSNSPLAAGQPPLRQASRRSFLAATGGFCGTLACFAAAPAIAATRATRSLSFVHTHTGETLRATYFQDGRYQPDSLARVDQLLRDFRTGDVHRIDPGVLDILFDLQTLANRDDAFEVVSGYRSPATNAMLHRSSDGVAQHSMHLEGRAIDVRLRGYPTQRLAEHARRLSLGGVGYYARSDFVHVDTGRIRYW
jgi:uncharacterized protein YcbK (DUF882 family)